MKKVINHKGWLTAILSIIPFFIFVSFFQGFGVGLSNVLGKMKSLLAKLLHPPYLFVYKYRYQAPGYHRQSQTSK